jgi:hypothetical protein
MRIGLNRSHLKNIALVFMVVDNAWLRFPESFSSVAHLVTRFVAPLFAWLMVDGFFHTRSKGRYCQRLWIAAALMQVGNAISFALFKERGITDNIFLTLALGFTIIWLFELAKDADGGKRVWLRVAAIVLTMLGLLFSIALYIPLPFGSAIMVEGGLQLIPFILIAYFFHGNTGKQATLTLVYSLLLFFTLYGGLEGVQNFDMFCVNSDWMVFSVIPFMFLYNGEEGRKSAFGKWFFYAFYPIHLWVLAVLSVVVL